MQPEKKLVYMANQIGKFFNHQGDAAPAQIADHLDKFWDPRMKATMFAHLSAGGEGLDPPVLKAVTVLQTQVAARAAKKS